MVPSLLNSESLRPQVLRSKYFLDGDLLAIVDTISYS